jgi:quinol monooxygenase YgiN
MLIVTAKVKLQSGKADEFIEAARAMQAKVVNDPGAIQYSLHRSTIDPDQFIFYERYEDEAAFAYHLSTDHLKAFGATIDPLMEAPGEFGNWVEVL